HDRLFKELISTFFVEFIELFFPQLMDYLDRNSITFLDKEVFTDVTEGERYESDLVAQVKFRGKESFFLIHVEAQESSRQGFNRRMFTYFARFHEKFVLPIYPIVIFSYSKPKREAISQYVVYFPDFKVLEFNYQVVQLNRLNWRDFLNQPNPVASALMAKMNIAEKERAKVKAECLRLLITLRLNPAKMQLISGFIDTYLNLNPVEERQFQEEISTFSQPVQEGVMQITTSWMRQGIERGIEQGIEREKTLIIRQLKRKLGEINPSLETKIMELSIDDVEALGEALFDFSTVEDLINWLNTLTA
ncbi:DUF4351 domain-containing protein, partial [Microcystis sp. M62BS1]